MKSAIAALPFARATVDLGVASTLGNCREAARLRRAAVRAYRDTATGV